MHSPTDDKRYISGKYQNCWRAFLIQSANISVKTFSPQCREHAKCHSPTNMWNLELVKSPIKTWFKKKKIIIQTLKVWVNWDNFVNKIQLMLIKANCNLSYQLFSCFLNFQKQLNVDKKEKWNKRNPLNMSFLWNSCQNAYAIIDW